MIIIVLAQRQALPVVRGRLYGDRKKRQERCWQSVTTNAQSVLRQNKALKHRERSSRAFPDLQEELLGELWI